MNTIQHIGLCVRDLDKTLAWYAKWFGFIEVKRFEKPEFEVKGAVISLAGQSIEILAPYNPVVSFVETAGIVKTLAHLGLNHMAIGVDDVAKLYLDLKASGISMVTELVDGRFFFCRDPDGTVLEIKRAG